MRDVQTVSDQKFSHFVAPLPAVNDQFFRKAPYGLKTFCLQYETVQSANITSPAKLMCPNLCTHQSTLLEDLSPYPIAVLYQQSFFLINGVSDPMHEPRSHCLVESPEIHTTSGGNFRKLQIVLVLNIYIYRYTYLDTPFPITGSIKVTQHAA